MRTLVHLSDLHFGRVDHSLLDPLVDMVTALAPNVVVVSGDLTQRARSAEFIDAKKFLARLPGPQIVVPGNHDVPLHNVFDRTFRPLHKFRRYVEPDLSPFHADQHIAVVGLNTARSFVIKNGRVNQDQLELMRQALQPLDEAVIRVVVTHHPFDVAPEVDAKHRVGRADIAMEAFAHLGVDVLLAGHMHESRVAGSGTRYALGGYEALIVSAGTATSTRGRGEANSFNLLKLQKHCVEVERFEWRPEEKRFTPAGSSTFLRQIKGWMPSAEQE